MCFQIKSDLKIFVRFCFIIILKFDGKTPKRPFANGIPSLLYHQSIGLYSYRKETITKVLENRKNWPSRRIPFGECVAKFDLPNTRFGVHLTCLSRRWLMSIFYLFSCEWKERNARVVSLPFRRWDTASPGCLKKEENEKEESDADAFIVAEFKLFFECRRDIPNRRDGTRDGMTCREFDRHLFLFCLVLMSKLWDLLTNLGDTRDGWCAATYWSCQETLGNGTLCDTPSSRWISSIYFPIWKNVFFNLKKKKISFSVRASVEVWVWLGGDVSVEEYIFIKLDGFLFDFVYLQMDVGMLYSKGGN